MKQEEITTPRAHKQTADAKPFRPRTWLTSLLPAGPGHGYIWAGGAIVTVLVLIAITAPLLAPYSPTASDLGSVTPENIPGPSWAHWFGLDVNGRDVLSRLIYGARTSLITGVAATLIGLCVGLVVGSLSALLGGVVDAVLMRLVDVLMTVPSLVLSIGVAALLGRSPMAIIIAISFSSIPTFARLIRSALLVEKEASYAFALKTVGFGRGRISVKHVIPNAVSPLITQGTMGIATSILDAAALAFLGLGSQNPAQAEWGRMLAESQQSLATDPRLAFLPCIAIIIAALGFTFLGEGLSRKIGRE
jgi:peptide/nickel transport system permease protein